MPGVYCELWCQKSMSEETPLAIFFTLIFIYNLFTHQSVANLKANAKADSELEA